MRRGSAGVAETRGHAVDRQEQGPCEQRVRVLAGLGGGALKGGRFLTFNNAHNQLLVSILHMMGFRDQNTFGDPEWSGPLPGLVS